MSRKPVWVLDGRSESAGIRGGYCSRLASRPDKPVKVPSGAEALRAASAALPRHPSPRRGKSLPACAWNELARKLPEAAFGGQAEHAPGLTQCDGCEELIDSCCLCTLASAAGTRFSTEECASSACRPGSLSCISYCNDAVPLNAPLGSCLNAHLCPLFCSLRFHHNLAICLCNP